MTDPFNFIILIKPYTNNFLCYSFSQKVDEEESGGGVALHPPDGFYTHQHSIHSHHGHTEPDRGYMEGNRYVTAVHRPLPGKSFVRPYATGSLQAEELSISSTRGLFRPTALDL